MKKQYFFWVTSIIIPGLFLLNISGCNDEEVASLMTLPVSEITAYSALSGGDISSDGGMAVTSRGVVWTTHDNPTLEQNEGITEEGGESGLFYSLLTDLLPGTSYYVRAYAINGVGIAYGNLVQFTTPTALPAVTTGNITGITATTAQGIGNVTDDGGGPVTSRGLVFSTLQNPTTSDSTIHAGTGAGSFAADLSGLSQCMTYFVRAFATNSAGTAYGNQVIFRTEMYVESNTFVDPRDGQTYKWLQIGEQSWMAENLRYLPSFIESGSGSYRDPFYRRDVYEYYGKDVNEAKATDNFKNYGVLYNWPAVMEGASSSNSIPSGVQGACPPGWHVPSDAEWSQLTDYVASQGYPATNTPNGAGNALKSCRQLFDRYLAGYATSEHPGWPLDNKHQGFDAFGFSAVPGGYVYLDGEFYSLGSGFWWSATENSSNVAWYRSIKAAYGDVTRYYVNCSISFSVRCLKDTD